MLENPKILTTKVKQKYITGFGENQRYSNNVRNIMDNQQLMNLKSSQFRDFTIMGA